MSNAADRIDELKIENVSLKEQVKDLEEKVTYLRVEIGDLRAQLTTARSRRHGADMEEEEEL